MASEKIDTEPPEVNLGSEIDVESASTTLSEIQPVEESNPRISKVKSRASSLVNVGAHIVPRLQRRGLLGRLTVIPEVDTPREYTNSTKWLLTAVVALAACAAPMGSAIFYPALDDISKDLDSTPTIANLSVAFYMLSMSIFPLWWSSFSESLGRRTIYLVSFSLFVVWSILSAVSTNIAMLVVMRILGGGASASVQAVGAGTIADLWAPKERGRAMGIFYLGPLMGPLLAPIVGGALTEGFGWRSTQWFLAIYGGILWILLLLCLPETLANTKPGSQEQASTEKSLEPLTQVSTRQSVQVKSKILATYFQRYFLDPLSVLQYLRFPAVLLTVYYASVAFGSLYVLNMSVETVFAASPYNYSTLIIGLLYIPNSIGYILVSLTGGKWIDAIMAREARRAGRYDSAGELIYIPEDRLRENAWVAAVMFPAAMVWYGWTAGEGIFWLVPMIANFFFGVGSMLLFSAATTMLTEFMPRRSSSGVAINNFVRNIFSCVGCVVTVPLLDAIGNGWLFTGLAVISWVSGFGVIWAIKKFGPQWRVEMNKHLA